MKMLSILLLLSAFVGSVAFGSCPYEAMNNKEGKKAEKKGMMKEEMEEEVMEMEIPGKEASEAIE